MDNEMQNVDNSWGALARQQRLNEKQEQTAANQRLFDGFMNIESNARQRQIALDQNRAVAGAAAIVSAYRNGGMSDRSLSDSLSQAFGQPIFGGQIVDMGKGAGKSFVLYGAANDPKTGQASIAPVAMLDDANVARVLQKANIGDRGNAALQEFYGSAASRLTPDQLGSLGLRSPSAPISTGGVTMTGAAVRALRGTPEKPSRIGFFAADGQGGFSESVFDRKTGENAGRDYGARDPRYAGRWRMTGADNAAGTTRYENSETGEVVDVPRGETLQNVLRGTSEKERIERMKQENMNNRANMRQEQFDKKFALEQQKLDEQIQGRLAAAKSAEEKNAILKEAKDAEMKLRQEEIESKYAQMGAQYGFGETRKAAQEKITEKLAPSPATPASDADATVATSTREANESATKAARARRDAAYAALEKRKAAARAPSGNGGATSAAPTQGAGAAGQGQGAEPTAQPETPPPPPAAKPNRWPAVARQEEANMKNAAELDALSARIDADHAKGGANDRFPDANPYEVASEDGKHDIKRAVRAVGNKLVNREELPSWVKGLSLEDQTRFAAARSAMRGIEGSVKELSRRQGVSSLSSAESYDAMLKAWGPGGKYREKLKRLLSIIDKIGAGAGGASYE